MKIPPWALGIGFIVFVVGLLVTISNASKTGKVELAGPGGFKATLEPAGESTAAKSTPKQSSPTVVSDVSKSSCDPAPDGNPLRELPNSEIWYGPFTDNSGILILSDGGFKVYEPNKQNDQGGRGVITPFPDPQKKFPTSQWFQLEGTRFSVCIDSNSKFFAIG